MSHGGARLWMGMCKAAGFAEHEGISVGPKRKNFLGVTSAAGAPAVPPAALLLP